MTTVGDALTSVCPDQTVVEVAPTDPAPVALIDTAPDAAALSAFVQERCEGSPALAIPAFAYPVSLAYNVIGVEGLVITPEAMAGILDGTLTSFEDPLITEANAGYDLSGLPPISLLGLESPQGSVQAMTAWLSQEVPTTWTSGVVGQLPVATPVATTTDLLGELTAVEGTAAILPAFTAANNVIPTVAVPIKGTDSNGVEFDTVVTSEDVQLKKVGSGATTVTEDAAGNLLVGPAVGGVPNPEVFDLIASKIVLAEDQPLVGWPVLGYAHLLVCDSPTNPRPLAFAQYLVRLAGQGALESYGATPLPEPIRVKTFLPLRVTVATDAPSLSSSPS
jgi:ABC-type phosphate transport system substrate-binding protein